MWYSNNMFRYMLKTEFVTLVSLKVPSGSRPQLIKVAASRKRKEKLLWYYTTFLLCSVMGLGVFS